jgi:TRAP-type uncharacterized transport system fused permease subunit
MQNLLKNLMKSKKGGLREAPAMVWTLVLIGIFLGVGLYILQKFRDQLTAGSEAWTGVNETIVGIGEFPTWITIIVVVIAASIIIGLVVKGFGGGEGM